ncbi:GDSL esterase/lipase EXL1-like [Pyrus communis]|uniref:GDSL esterase/lipase EXL1-like n=1 Tax=Pyrus communis TaxID=23211 RepID=UPI0035C24AF2
MTKGKPFKDMISLKITVKICQGALSLPAQLEHFKEYTAKLKGSVEEKRTRKIITNSLFLVSASSSGILRSYPSFIRKFRYDFPSYAALLDLCSLGARRIGVFSAVAIGCTSLEISSTGLLRECLKLQNQSAELFNSLLSNELDYINSNFTDAKLVFLDIYHHS